jgi:predicted metal-dependent RNase
MRPEQNISNKEQLMRLTNQLRRELFSAPCNRNLKAAKNTLAAINQIVKNELKIKKVTNDTKNVK